MYGCVMDVDYWECFDYVVDSDGLYSDIGFVGDGFVFVDLGGYYD